MLKGAEWIRVENGNEEVTSSSTEIDDVVGWVTTQAGSVLRGGARAIAVPQTKSDMDRYTLKAVRTGQVIIEHCDVSVPMEFCGEALRDMVKSVVL